MELRDAQALPPPVRSRPPTCISHIPFHGISRVPHPGPSPRLAPQRVETDGMELRGPQVCDTVFADLCETAPG